MRKIINSENVQYQPVLTEELVLDAKATVGSFNGITSDAVARAIAGASGLPESSSADEGKVLTVDANGDPEWADAQGGGGSSTSAFDTTFNLVNDGATWRLSKDSSVYINLTGGAGVYAYRVAAEITDSSNPTEIADLYKVTVRVGSISASETKTLYLKSDTSGYPDDPTSLSFNTSGILDVSSAQHVRGMNVYVGIIPAKGASGTAVTSFTGGSVTLYLAKLSTLSGGWQPES